MMTQQSPPTDIRTGWKTLERLRGAARAVLAFERLWPRLWPASGLAGLFLALAWLGVPQNLPWPAQALVLAGFVTAIALSLCFSLDGFRWPSGRDAARRLEIDSALHHRPISEAQDALAAGTGDATAEALWRAHRQAQSVEPATLRLSLPETGLAARDPHALRFAVLLLIGIGFIASWGHWGGRFAAAFGPAAGSGPRIDAWIDPPAYTGEAPIYLADTADLSVPVGATLNIRVHGATRAPYLALSDTGFPYLSQSSRKLDGGDGEFSAQLTLHRAAMVRVRADGQTLGRWTVTTIPDLAPSIAFAAKPGRDAGGVLKLAFTARDDYAVTQIHAVIRPCDVSGPPLVLDLSPAPAKDVRATIRRDLTSHPYAGLPVEIAMVAADASGHIAVSQAVRITLPSLLFSDPLAKALVEMRRLLATKGWAARGKTMRLLDGLTLTPELFFGGRQTVYLALRTAYWGLHHATSASDLPRIEELLWQTAAALERGGLTALAEALRQLQHEISQLLATGAPQSEIDAALERYAQLMQRYLHTMAQTPGAEAKAQADAKMLGTKDLADLLAAIQAMAQSGDRDQAAQLLAFLQNLIENMRMSAGGGGAGSTEDNKAVRDLSDLMGRQRQLLDKTFRESMRSGNPKDGGTAGLARQQEALRAELTEQTTKQNKPSPPLQEAEKRMREAVDALRMGDLPRAGTLQKYVLDALRKGAAAMAGKPAGGAQANQDPFGRKSGAQGGTLNLPDAGAMRRARDILLELRRRAGEMNRPKEERDYIDRLLQQF